MKPVDLLKLQMELEGIKVQDDTFITRLDPDVTEFPLVLFASTSDKQKLIYFDCTLSPDLSNKLISSDLNSFNVESAIETFATFGVNTKSDSFRTYTFPDNIVIADDRKVKIFKQDDPKVIAYGFNGMANEIYAIEEDGRLISACVSARQNKKCAEAWVFTDPNHRRKGFARQVVMSWAAHSQHNGIIPFYSHEIRNTSSANLAGKLNLLHIFDETVIERSRGV